MPSRYVLENATSSGQLSTILRPEAMDWVDKTQKTSVH